MSGWTEASIRSIRLRSRTAHSGGSTNGMFPSTLTTLSSSCVADEGFYLRAEDLNLRRVLVAQLDDELPEEPLLLLPTIAVRNLIQITFCGIIHRKIRILQKLCRLHDYFKNDRRGVLSQHEADLLRKSTEMGANSMPMYHCRIIQIEI